MKLRTCLMDMYGETNKWGILKYSGAHSLLDYEMVIWDVESSFSRCFSNMTEPNVAASRRVKEQVSRRRSELKDFFRMGGTAVVHVPHPITRQLTGDNEEWTPMALVPVPRLPALVPSLGEKIEWRGDSRVQQALSRYTGSMRYRAYFQQSFGNPLAYVAGTDKLVGSWLPVDQGKIIFLPQYAGKDSEFTEFVKALQHLSLGLNDQSGLMHAPGWVKSYRLPDEDTLCGEIGQLEKQVEALMQSIEARREDLRKLEDYKLLLWGSGKALETQVLRLFAALGLDAKFGERGRDDIQLFYRGKVAIVEVKGVTKSAAEKQAAQLEKWVSEYRSNHDDEAAPKGILLVNAFSETDFTKRSEPAFPSQMLRYATNREHCLMTTTQLFAIYLLSRNHPEKVAEALDAIFTTSGVLNGYDNLVDLLVCNKGHADTA